jgi:hypothetical protein
VDPNIADCDFDTKLSDLVAGCEFCWYAGQVGIASKWDASYYPTRLRLRSFGVVLENLS